MGWDSDYILFNLVRDKILKDRYAGCCYTYGSSLSPVIINYRGIVTTAERAQITALFPHYIRVEFQPYPDEFVGEDVVISVMGATQAHPMPIQLADITENTLARIADSLTAISVTLNWMRESKEKINNPGLK